ncbi:MAG: aminotransferase class I/II-fold pyridoxal phosphate-dependent enzyme [Acidobacteria bacterium]|nr:aminotransferase class I/II-fold pyridoxal phosphate-dependent enzyme [Acidobacteriota bacterium]
MDERSVGTWVVSGGRSSDRGSPLNSPVVLASNFRAGGLRTYSREHGTATISALEELVGQLEGGHAVAFSSGMGACAAVINLLPVGANVLLPTDCYHGVSALIDQGVEQRRWSATRIDGADTPEWIEAAANADLIWLESPSNPLLAVSEIPSIAAADRKPGALVVVDNTFATPLNQRPLDVGADIVMHSATKFLGGHSDLLSGVLVTKDQDLEESLRRQRTIGGATPGALESYLVTRGIRTLVVRMRRAEQNAVVLAGRLYDHPEVVKVRYPGLPSHESYEIAQRVLDGPGAMMSFDVSGDGSRATRLCDALEIIQHATSLGGVESTMERRAPISGQGHLPPTLIRFSVGIEDVDDLWRDIVQALEVSRSR